MVDRIIMWETKGGHITTFNTSEPNWRDAIRYPLKGTTLRDGRPVITQGDYLDYVLETENTTIDFIREIDPTNKDDVAFANQHGVVLF